MKKFYIAYDTDVTDNKYHLTSFRVDNDERLNENEINNSLKEKEYIFSEGIKQAHSIEVTAEIDTYTVSVTTDDGGIVEVNGSSEKNIIVDSGAEVAIIVKPNEGKTVKIFSVNGTPIQENNLTEDEDGTAVYKIENVNGDQNVTAEFEDIQNENKDSLALAGLNLLDSGNNQITADEDGNYYSSSAILKFDGKTKISLSQWGVGKTQLNLTETTIISSVYKGGIIGRKQISLNPSVKIVIDTTKPKIELSDDEKTIWKTEADTTVDITGTAVDENLKKVVWSETELTPDDVLNGAQEAALNENGKFEISGIQLAKNQNIDKIYIYAIDKAKQCSEAGVITVYRDSAAPEIKEVSLIPADTIKKYNFGNYYNANITVKVTAKDVDVKDSKSGYPAVGVKEIRIYSDDDTKVYTGTVSTQVSGTSDATIEVTIPLEEAGTFASLKKVHIKAVDALGNESKAYKFTEITNHNDILSDDLMLEKDAPVVKVTPQADGKYENAKDGKTEYWYKDIPTIACEVTDQKNQTNGSGLAARTVTVNGDKLTSKAKNFVESITGSDQIVQEDSLTLSANDLKKVREGENTVVTTYTDIAGNETIDTKTICLDTHKPDVTRFNIEKKDASKILNILTFGNYGNGVIKVTVTADDLYSDDDSEVPSAGLNEITLYVGEEAYQTKAVGSDNTAVFELPAETVLNEQKVYLDKKISAIVTDNVGNQSEKTLVTTANSNVKNSNLMIETVKPTITSVLSAEGYVGKNGIIYNNSDTGVSIKVEDKDSGIYSVKASVNNKELVNVSYPDQKTVTESYEINTKDAVINADTKKELILYYIKAELLKRQSLFAEANVNHIDKYIKLYKEGKVQIPLPHLVIVVDEFAELKAEQPEFMKELISAARIGRSLGIHLILATQKPAGQVNEQIWSNSKFKLCLKVQNQEDSKEVLKSPLAAEIREPGRAYLQVGNNEIFELFQSAFSGAPAVVSDDNLQKKFKILQCNFNGRRSVVYEKKNSNEKKSTETELDAIVKYIHDYCEKEKIQKLPNICLPPLLDCVVYSKQQNKTQDRMLIPLGIYDDPDSQYQGLMLSDFGRMNTLIIGTSQMGKTNWRIRWCCK